MDQYENNAGIPDEEEAEIIAATDENEAQDAPEAAPEEQPQSVEEPRASEETPVPEETSAAKAKNKGKEPESPALFAFDLLELVALSLAVVMLLLTFVLRQSPVLGRSMNPTIKGQPEHGETGDEMSGEDVLLISNLFYTPQSGDIVVIQTPTVYGGNAEGSMDHSIVKRVIAVGGDLMTIDFKNWRVEIERNGKKFVFEEGLDENGVMKTPYVNYEPGRMMDRGLLASETKEDLASAIVKVDGHVYTLKIPEGKIFVMGDNRNHSQDSRRIGFIDERWIAGKAILRILPFDRFGTV